MLAMPTTTPAPREPTADQLDDARKQTLTVLQDQQTPERIQRHYDPTTNYAGRSYIALSPTEPDNLTAADLYAVSLLNVKVGPAAGRRLLHDGPHRQTVLETLRAIPDEAELAHADNDTMLAMERLHQAIKTALGGNRWVTASKLCARKRSRLFPVRDNLVTGRLLGLAKDRWTDWVVYQSLITNDAILQHLEHVTHQARTLSDADVLIDDAPLRVLDVALWMYATAERNTA